MTFVTGEQWTTVEDWAWVPEDYHHPDPGYRWAGTHWERDLAYHPPLPEGQGATPAVSVNGEGFAWKTLLSMGGTMISVHNFSVESSGLRHTPIILTVPLEHLDITDQHALVHLLDHRGHAIGTVHRNVRALYTEDHWRCWIDGQEQPYCTSLAVHGDAQVSLLKVQATISGATPLAEVTYGG